MQKKKREDTHAVELHVVQRGGDQKRRAHVLHLVEPLPPGGMVRPLPLAPLPLHLRKHPRVAAVLRPQRTYQQHNRTEPGVLQMQVCGEGAGEGGAVQEGQDVVGVREVERGE